MTLKAIVFDAYGTLFDVYSVGALAEELFPDHGTRLSALWRDKQIDYTRLRTLSHQYRDFWAVTEDALDFSCASLGLTLTPDARDRLMGAYATLTAFPENFAVLQNLKAKGIPLAILSNGTPKMLDQAITAAGFQGLFTHVLSVDPIRRYKTAPEAYQLAPDTFACPVSEILFVSSNGWDICGATWFGFRTIWLNRQGLPLERLGVEPHRVGRSLADVAEYAQHL